MYILICVLTWSLVYVAFYISICTVCIENRVYQEQITILKHQVDKLKSGTFDEPDNQS